MYDDQNTTRGLVQALVLDGQGGARPLAYDQLPGLALAPHESLWLHWDRSHPDAQAWLRERSGLSEFVCDLLLEENTRPRLVPLPEAQMLLFMRGVNLNPGAQPEDMVSLRIFAEAQRVISLRLRPLRATDELIMQLREGKGPRTASELVLYMAQHLTERIQTLVETLTDHVDGEEDRIDADDRYQPDHPGLLQVRRRAAALRRFLAPQRDIYGQLARVKLPWFVEDDGDYWSELNNSLTRYLEELELTRERVALLLESEDRRLSERMNRTMYRFGVITGIFLPMTFLTGLLGINVGGIPGSGSPYGFAATCLLLLALAAGQWLIFRRLRWL
ncbi:MULTISPECIES: CorA family divalent cation transporter [unclassified Pseudomonas]|uniref:CorA family divalent cation transporter n=1 Tax=unclassified Pseudomonas TaxID=196821 RepID=UPI000BCBDDC0|nr:MULTISPECIES: CorA family divalent cation transporter [unclassified Pseudomonas]PVZ13606.1 zinc transporter [Pseudomonas sp. URIL14HWK12:I12]PVZ23912.1 zinc transporter [Pseudomonas sp. URIL14HWK12:I10]PVZ33449.1 zinc transporter [Pseudomonas sp. URIL14HWK12:I11]SNZ11599.1 zinc transporter [Pseudomonas sp. URIL14HWK12:I9]